MSVNVAINKLAFLFAVSLLTTLSINVAQADVSEAAFSEPYHKVAPASPSQSQVVFYRLGVPKEKAPEANIYVDKEFHTALLPGGYTVFCVAPGIHSVNSVFEDAPIYVGKQDEPSLQLQVGQTVFLQVSEVMGQEPRLVGRDKAEQDLSGNLRQTHVLSRASSVLACNSNVVASTGGRSYSLSSDVLFGFGKSGYQDIRENGRKAVGDLVRKLRQENANIEEIEVVGHTDRIGKDAANDALGLRRAQTVRQLLIDNGLSPVHINARSVGSRSPVTDDCRGNKQDLIACYAPDRRVVIQLRAQQK